MPDCSVDAVVTDPPYGLSFMGKKWDYDVPGVMVWAECLRVLKPGGHLLAFAGTRTQHRMAVRIEDAGFEIRDMIAWVYGSGFPKSLDVSKAIDKAAGAEREVLGVDEAKKARFGKAFDGSVSDTQIWPSAPRNIDITIPATPEAKQWQGWGTALKPALEPITVARKPLIGTVAENVLQHGTGAINVDGCRVGTEPPAPRNAPKKIIRGGKFHASADSGQEMSHYNPTQGRWPANFIHDGSEEVVALFPYSKSVGGDGYKNSMFAGGKKTGGHGLGDAGSAARFFYCAKASKADRDAGLDSIEIISIFAAWEKEDLQVRLLVDTATSPPRVTVESTVQHKNAPEWSTLLFGNQFMERFQMATKYTTSTEISSTIESRTLRALAHCITSGYIPGVSCVQTDGTNPAVSAATSNTLTITIDEATASALGANPAQSQMQFRISASDGRNIHSTVKPTDLMRYLCRLVTPLNGVVLDPFMGSGSTGKAAALEGFSFIGIEREAEYVAIAQARINHVTND
jgi:predicted RNA methylase